VGTRYHSVSDMYMGNADRQTTWAVRLDWGISSGTLRIPPLESCVWTGGFPVIMTGLTGHIYNGPSHYIFIHGHRTQKIPHPVRSAKSS
jgi:hypothetical protein